MKNLYLDKDLKRGLEKTVLKLVEEVGELAEAILLQDKEKITEEIVDIIAWTLSVANIARINVEEGFIHKYSNSCPKCKNNPCSCDSI
ncbi:MAG: nucleotide pyrophosphohydrolase [Candidatus Heimdallarchaeota archaeon]|nr:nucleotide pyrophosphohydrolase [Candidatus Heimdallarchaeota archaeon]